MSTEKKGLWQWWRDYEKPINKGKIMKQTLYIKTFVLISTKRFKKREKSK